MPIYGYHCDSCSHEFEILQSMTAAPLTACPECGGRLRKLLYPVGVQFKGAGFYTTDYRDGGKAKAEAKPDGQGDAKPETKAEGKPGESSDGKTGEKKSETSAASSPAKPESKHSGTAKKD